MAKGNPKNIEARNLPRIFLGVEITLAIEFSAYMSVAITLKRSSGVYICNKWYGAVLVVTRKLRIRLRFELSFQG